MLNVLPFDAGDLWSPFEDHWMPWKSPAAFALRHNKKLKGAAASKAKALAEAMIARGAPEGEAIATANKTGDREMRRRGLYDHPRSRS